MLNTLFDRSTLPLLEQTVAFTEARHGVLAGNVANLDTPGYRCRDLSPEEFRKQLREAVQARRSDASGASPGDPFDPAWARDPARPSATGRANPISTVAAQMKGMLRHDDNNASLEEQITEIAKNQSQHDMALSLMRAQFGLLRAAITERA
ncbi:MAG: flagellar basal body rod protein FlgB [Planctomycetota bacterium]|nr:MAG: flagellar basal body rod protein FlgB [Planctomycetota bacterium]